MKFLPKTSTFKLTVRDTERHKRIKEVLENETFVPYIAFIAVVGNNFEIFLKTFQSMKSRIHITYPEMRKLLTSSMSKFIKSKLLTRDDSNNAKSVSDLLTLNLKDTKNCKPLKLIVIGTKAKCSFPKSLDITSTEKKLWHNCVEAYQAFVSHLRLKFPWKSTILRNAIFLDPAKRGNKRFLNAITNLTKEVSKTLEGVLQKIFPTCSTTDEVCNQIRNEWRMCQIHLLTETSYNNEANETTQGRCQMSYWENALKLLVYLLIVILNARLTLTLLSFCLRRRLLTMLGHPNSI